MVSSTPIESIPPVIEYLLYGTFGLLCLAITIGIVILMRRHAMRDEMTGLGEIDYPKIASQLQKEITRLQALRDRIYPEGAADVAIAEANRSVSSPAVVSAEQGASLASMSEVDLKELPEVQSLLQKEIDQLNKEHAAALEKIQAVAKSAPGSAVDTSAKDEEIEALKSEIAALKSAKASSPVGGAEESAAEQKLATEIKGLKEQLSEYEIFGEDLSRVKELTRELKELKNKLAGSAASSEIEVSAPSEKSAEPAVDSEPSSKAIASQRTSSLGTIDGEVNEAAFEAAVETESPEVVLGGTSNESTAAKSEAEIPKGFEGEKVAQDPAVTPSPKTAELSAAETDDLMAEFEKLLGTVDKA